VLDENKQTPNDVNVAQPKLGGWEDDEDLDIDIWCYIIISFNNQKEISLSIYSSLTDCLNKFLRVPASATGVATMRRVGELSESTNYSFIAFLSPCVAWSASSFALSVILSLCLSLSDIARNLKGLNWTRFLLDCFDWRLRLDFANKDLLPN